jgi:hypothetical protein
MAAVTGLVAAELGRWPGYIAPGENLKFADVPNGIAAIGSIPFLGWAQIILFVGGYYPYSTVLFLFFCLNVVF